MTVENTSSSLGLGTHAARVIESGSMKVAMIKSTEAEVDKCVVATNLKTRTAVGVKWLAGVFGCDWEKSWEGDGEVLLRLGKEYKEWWLGN